MHITHKDWVCLVDQETVERARQRSIEASPSFRGFVLQQFWRQISLLLNAEGMTLSLGDVNEEAAKGGYWNCSMNCHTHRFTWPDLDDAEFVKSIVAREQYIVAERVLQMLEALRIQRLVFKRALTASFDSSATADTALAA